MKQKLLLKLLIIFLLVIGLTIPNLMIRDLVTERSTYRFEAKQGIAASWTSEQTLFGPILVVPYEERTERKVWNANKDHYRLVEQVNKKQLFVLPTVLKINAGIRTEERRRGIYAIPVYESSMDLRGSFDNKALLTLVQDKAVSVAWERIFVSVPVSDIRGITVQPVLDWKDTSAEFVSGAGLEKLGNGMHAFVDGLNTSEPTQFAFSFSVQLHGMERLQFAPVGKSTQVSVVSSWPHPSFLGRYLPTERQIDDEGFTATWRVASFSSDMDRIGARCQVGDCEPFFENTFGVALIQPVDIYQQAERSVKYAILIITLTFVAFFLFEVMRAIPLHPMQYLLVGCSLTVFYLLLLSLSEHIAFGWAYLIASLANSVLVGAYVSAVMNSRFHALVLTGSLLMLYGMLYLILRSEDNALLMGSLLIFAVLAFVMLLTRDLDWYRVSEQVARHAEHKPGRDSLSVTSPVETG